MFKNRCMRGAFLQRAVVHLYEVLWSIFTKCCDPFYKSAVIPYLAVHQNGCVPLPCTTPNRLWSLALRSTKTTVIHFKKSCDSFYKVLWSLALWYSCDPLPCGTVVIPCTTVHACGTGLRYTHAKSAVIPCPALQFMLATSSLRHTAVVHSRQNGCDPFYKSAVIYFTNRLWSLAMLYCSCLRHLPCGTRLRYAHAKSAVIPCPALRFMLSAPSVRHTAAVHSRQNGCDPFCKPAVIPWTTVHACDIFLAAHGCGTLTRNRLWPLALRSSCTPNFLSLNSLLFHLYSLLLPFNSLLLSLNSLLLHNLIPCGTFLAAHGCTTVHAKSILPYYYQRWGRGRTLRHKRR